MEALLQLSEAVQAGLGRTALIIGEAGLGKSRLVSEWRSTCERLYPSRIHWVEAHCLSYGQGLAYHLLIILLRSFLAISETEDESKVHARLKTMTSEADTILRDVLTSDAPAQSHGQRMVWCARAELALARGDGRQALQITDHLIAHTKNFQIGQSILRVSKIRGDALISLGRLEEAETVLLEVKEIAAAQGARPFLWRILASLGMLYHRQGKTTIARDMAEAAKILILTLAAGLPEPSLKSEYLDHAQIYLDFENIRYENRGLI